MSLPNVVQALDAVASAVRAGEFTKAAALGAQAPVPLCLGPELVIEKALDDGKGGQADVKLGRLHGRQVAVKVPKLHTTADLARFRVEIATLARLAHCPGVVQLRGARCLPPSYCLVMDLGGPSLASLIYDSTPAWRPAWDQLLSLGVQLARALAAVHEAGIVHRDIKPRNILVTTNPVRAQLCDFGVAVCPEVERALGLHDDDPACGGAGGKAAQGSTLGGGVKRAGPTGGFKKHLMVGTQEYMAPELILTSMPHSAASDVYALGVTLAEVATGLPPFADACRGADAPQLHTALEVGYGRRELATAVVQGLRPTLPQGPEEGTARLAAVLGACWAAEPGQRPSAAQVADELEALLGQHTQELRASKAQEGEDITMGDATGDDSLHSSRSTTPALATGGHAGGTAPARARLGSLSDSAASSTNFLSLQASQPQQGPSQAAQEVRLASDVRVTAAAVEAVGPRETQEDAHVVGVGADVDDVLDRLWGQLHGLEPMQDCSEGEVQAGVAASAAANGRHAVLAVFDGHRGHGASQFAAARARPVFEAKLAEAVAGVTAAQRHAPARGLSSPDLDLTSTVLASALRATLHQLEHEYTSQWEVALAEAATKGARGGAVMEGAAKLGTCPGCTALVVVVWGGVLGVANVGDCRAVLWRDGRAVQLTRDHNAQYPEERARVAAAGGAAMYHPGTGGGWRLVGSGLQVCRALGDCDLKAVSRGLTADPEVTMVPLQEGDEWVLVGSDGLFEGLTPPLPPALAAEVEQGAGGLGCEAGDVWRAAASAGAAGALIASTVRHPAMVCRRLTEESLLRGSKDNVTALLAYLQPVSTMHRVF